MAEFNYYSLTPEQIFEKLGTNNHGLSDQEAKDRLAKFGRNQLTTKSKISPLSMYLSQFKNTLTLILIGSTLLILFIYFFGERDSSDLIEAGLILTIVFMITILGFIQEYKAEKAIESLKKLLAFKAKVRRGGHEREVDVTELVPGDIVILEEGEKIPADIRLFEVFNLNVNEAALTGESNPVTKISNKIDGNKQINDQKNMVFSGTAVASGRAYGVVVTTGDNTEIGKIAQSVADTKDEETPIQKRLDRIGKVLGFAVLGICSLVFVFIVFFAHDYDQMSILQRVIHSFVAAVSLAVAAIPEGLPAVVTISLALGTQRMLKKNALVRKLNSVETLGSTDAICSDKTGTLTKGEMTVREIYFDQVSYQISGVGYEQIGKFTNGGKTIDSSQLQLILQTGLQCNNASIGAGKVLGDPTEAALIISAMKAGVTKTLERVYEVPFSSERKRMSVVVKDDQNKLTVFAKGAPEELLKICTKVVKDGQEINLTSSEKELILQKAHEMSSKALRVLGFAYKQSLKAQPKAMLSGFAYKQSLKAQPKAMLSGFAYKNLDKKPTSENETESELIFLGLQGMIDPPRLEVKPLIESCQQSGIRVIMITGDHIDTAKAVATEIGIKGEALSGEELDKLTDEDLKDRVEKISIYARVNPSFKMRIVDALQKNGHIVAMTGDGVNDSPALKKADIGIAMGITGTDVAKEASDMVLLDDHFNTIVSAIEEGRGIYHNIRKFVNYLLACNIGEVLIVFCAVFFFKELPLTATMLLWINVITDGLPAIALGMDPAEKDILKHPPKTFQADIINRNLWIKMFVFGILLTVAVLGIYFINLKEGVLEAKGAAFTAIVMFELVQLYLIRSNYKIKFFSNKWLILAVFGSVLLQISIVYVPFLANLFGVKHIDIYDWSYIVIGSALIWVFYKILEKIIDQSHFLNPIRKTVVKTAGNS